VSQRRLEHPAGAHGEIELVPAAGKVENEDRRAQDPHGDSTAATHVQVVGGEPEALSLEDPTRIDEPEQGDGAEIAQRQEVVPDLQVPEQQAVTREATGVEGALRPLAAQDGQAPFPSGQSVARVQRGRPASSRTG
jgi:hypothetical protein